MNSDQAISRLLRAQFGVVTTRQLRDIGVSERTIRRRRGNDLEQLLPGVLRSLGHRLTFESRAMGVQLFVDDSGVLAGPTAARLYGVRNMPGEWIWAIIGVRSRSAVPPWVKRIVWPWLLEVDDVWLCHRGWRLLSPVATLVTLADTFNDHRFERAAEDAWHLKLVAPSDVADFVDRHRGRGRHGFSRLHRWLDKTAARVRPSQSTFELDVIAAVRRIGLPEPQRQYPLTLATGELVHLDLAWPEATLAVEPGHSWWHGGDLRVRADQARDRACGQVGWHVMRYDEDARNDLAVLAAEVLATYQRRR
jgi:hypothetical protein